MKFIGTLLLGLFLTFCSRHPSVVEQVRSAGELRVITRIDPTTYYEGPNGPTGFEYDLAKLFAGDLGVRLRMVTTATNAQALEMLSRGEGRLVASGLVVTPARKQVVRFGPTYQKITKQIVYLAGHKRPRTVEDLAGGKLEVVANGVEVDWLQELRGAHPGLTWKENDAATSEELIDRVQKGLIDYTIAGSREIRLARRFHPELRIGFDLEANLPLAWAFPQETDDSLYLAAIRFFNRIRTTGDLEQLVERYFGHVKRFDYVGTRTLLKHVEERLPPLIPFFKAAARAHGMDWRLLAAIGYQESHWDPEAVSPTGVRGIMMLTGTTANRMGIGDRADTRQSILGGARYFARVKRKVPERIPEPDRTWLALAAYNIGFGHLEDARRLTQAQNGDPDKWIDVEKRLPLLSKKKWYEKTRHGYARGQEPVKYVENVRRYYDLLLWHDTARQGKPPRSTKAAQIDAPAL